MRTELFPQFSQHWSPILASAALGFKKPLGVAFDGIPVVLFRDQKGVAQALVDRCPHRSVKLSLGRLRPDGHLQCAFHGWSFAGNGACQSIPLNPQAKLSAVCAQRVKVAEKGGLVWLNGSPDFDRDTTPLVPDALMKSDWFGNITVRDWNCHWSRALQTMLDVAHIPFVHPQSIGAAFGRALGKAGDATLSHQVLPGQQDGFRVEWKLASPGTATAGDKGWVEFHPPNGMSLGIPQKNPHHQSILFIWCVPIEKGRSRVIVVSRRNFGRYAPLPFLYNLLTPIILGEDRRNMETVWPSEIPDKGEVSMPSDTPTIAFQNYYRRVFGKT